MTIEVILLNRSVNYIHRDISIMMIIDNVHNLIHVLCWLTSFESIKQYDSTVERNSFTVGYIISALVVIFGLVVLSVIKYMENMSRYVEIFMQ